MSTTASAAILLTTLDPVPAEPGEFATFSCQVDHVPDGSRDLPPSGEVRVRFRPPEGWSALSTERGLVLSPGGSVVMPFTALVPLSADPTLSHDAIFELTYAPDDGVDQIAIRGATVRTRRGLDLSTAEDGVSARAGETVTLSVFVRNTGNRSDRVRVEGESVPNWEWEVEPSELSLGPGEEGSARVSLHVPETAREGTLHLLDLRATTTTTTPTATTATRATTGTRATTATTGTTPGATEASSPRDVDVAEAAVTYARITTAVLSAPEPEERFVRIPIAATFSAGSVSPGEESYAVHTVAAGGVGTESEFSLEANLASGASASGVAGWQNETLRARARRGAWELAAGDLGVALRSRLAPSFSGRGVRLAYEDGPWSAHLLQVEERGGAGADSWSAGAGRALGEDVELGFDLLAREQVRDRSRTRTDRVGAVHLGGPGPLRSSWRLELAESRSDLGGGVRTEGQGTEVAAERSGDSVQLRARANRGTRDFRGRTGDRDGNVLFGSWVPGPRSLRLWTNLESQSGGAWAGSDSMRTEISRGRVGLRFDPFRLPGFELSVGENEERTSELDSLTVHTDRRDLTFTTKLARGSFLAVSTWSWGRVRDLRASAEASTDAGGYGGDAPPSEGDIRTWEVNAGGRLGEFRTAMRWSALEEWNPSNGRVTRTTGWSADLSQHLRRWGAEIGASVGERTSDTGGATGRGHRQLTVEPRLDWRLHGKWSVRVDASFERVDGESRVQRWRVSLHHAPTELLPIPWVPLRGGLRGIVFVDLDGDGVPSGMEPRIENVVVRADGRSLTTDRHGEFTWRSLEPGTYWVEVDRGTLPAEFQPPVELPIEARVRAGDDSHVWIPLRPCGAVTGSVFLDEDRSGTWDGREDGLSDVRIGLFRDGVFFTSTITDADGRFEFAKVPVGTYELRADPNWLPQGLGPTQDAVAHTFELSEHSAPVLTPYGLAPRQKPIVITFPRR
ncbi:MAG: SdrD B-like domain-containing protein [Candidatus Eisenbacteria bacterium]